jgi:hypothetical protein
MPKDSSRESHFPAIEKKYGEKMAYWFKVMAKIKDKKVPRTDCAPKGKLRVFTSPCQRTCDVLTWLSFFEAV